MIIAALKKDSHEIDLDLEPEGSLKDTALELKNKGEKILNGGKTIKKFYEIVGDLKDKVMSPAEYAASHKTEFWE